MKAKKINKVLTLFGNELELIDLENRIQGKSSYYDKSDEFQNGYDQALIDMRKAIDRLKQKELLKNEK